MPDKKYTEKEAKALDDKTDYARLKAMTEQEVEENSESDPDALSPTDEQMKKFRKVGKDAK